MEIDNRQVEKVQDLTFKFQKSGNTVRLEMYQTTTPDEEGNYRFSVMTAWAKDPAPEEMETIKRYISTLQSGSDVIDGSQVHRRLDDRPTMERTASAYLHFGDSKVGGQG
jgi:hypothetical protein